STATPIHQPPLLLRRRRLRGRSSVSPAKSNEAAGAATGTARGASAATGGGAAGAVLVLRNRLWDRVVFLWRPGTGEGGGVRSRPGGAATVTVAGGGAGAGAWVGADFACTTVPQVLQRRGWWTHSAGIRSTDLQPGHVA